MRIQTNERAASRTQFIETRCVFSWDIAGELWTFRAGAQIVVGPALDLDGSPQVVTSAVAAAMIREGKAEAVCIRQIEERLAEDVELEMVHLDAEEAA